MTNTNPPYPLECSIEFIAPDRAANELATINLFNRPQKQQLIERIARDIAADRFKLNGEPIIYGDNGSLLDGQNRLASIVLAKKGVFSVVVRGVPKNCFDTIDGGAPRGLNDYLAIGGEELSKQLPPALKVALKIQNSGFLDNNFKPTALECHEFLEQHPEIRAHIKRIKKLGKLLIPPGLAAGIFFHLNEKKTLMALEWLDALVAQSAGKEMLVTQRPFQLMRDKLIQNLSARQRWAARDLYFVTVLPWNAIMQEVEMKRLSVPAKGTPLPEIQAPKSQVDEAVAA